MCPECGRETSEISPPTQTEVKSRSSVPLMASVRSLTDKICRSSAAVGDDAGVAISTAYRFVANRGVGILTRWSTLRSAIHGSLHMLRIAVLLALAISLSLAAREVRAGDHHDYVVVVSEK